MWFFFTCCWWCCSFIKYNLLTFLDYYVQSPKNLYRQRVVQTVCHTCWIWPFTSSFFTWCVWISAAPWVPSSKESLQIYVATSTVRHLLHFQFWIVHFSPDLQENERTRNKSLCLLAGDLKAQKTRKSVFVYARHLSSCSLCSPTLCIYLSIYHADMSVRVWSSPQRLNGRTNK